MKSVINQIALNFLMAVVFSIPGAVTLQQPAKTSPQASPATKEPQKKSVQDIELQAKLVTVPVAVTDSEGRYVTGLTGEDFEIFDENVRQRIAHFSDDDAPVSIGIVYDVSGSMTDINHSSMRALRRFIETSHADDDFFLVAFNDKAKLVQDFTTSADKLVSHLTLVNTGGSTALYDAAYLATEKVKQGRHTRKALLIISDGMDNNSRYTYKELREMVEEAGIQIYAIGHGGWGGRILQDITRLTGGRSFSPWSDSTDLFDACTRIAIELRQQYVIGFYPSDTTGNPRWRNIAVKVNAPKGLGRVSLRHKTGYRAFDK